MEHDLTFQVVKMLDNGMAREEINKALNINIIEDEINRLQYLLN